MVWAIEGRLLLDALNLQLCGFSRVLINIVGCRVAPGDIGGTIIWLDSVDDRWKPLNVVFVNRICDHRRRLGDEIHVVGHDQTGKMGGETAPYIDC